MSNRYWRLLAVVLPLLVFVLSGCGKAGHEESVTLSFSGNVYWQNPAWHQRLASFTRETGIEVNLVPYTEEEEDSRRSQSLDWLSRHSQTPDIYQADVTFISAIADEMLDLTPDAGKIANEHMPFVMDNYKIHGRLVALPLYTDVGLLYYRTDLLRKYGYNHPPATWDELEAMAQVIQKGERKSRHGDFWGYVWEGKTAAENLTASAYEVQASNGGGHIIEQDGAITVNNPYTVEALNRMHRWIGTISPPDTLTSDPFAVVNVWVSGGAAFMRNWPEFIGRKELKDGGTFAITHMPAGPAGSVGTLGGWQLSVSKYSAHPKEAVRLVEFLTTTGAQLLYAREWTETPTRLSVIRDPHLLQHTPDFAQVYDALETSGVPRPSVVAGTKYPDVSQAYAQAVEAVLNGRSDASAEIGDLEKQLVALTGFNARRPSERIAGVTYKRQ